jgi:hypothetical protein
VSVTYVANSIIALFCIVLVDFVAAEAIKGVKGVKFLALKPVLAPKHK